MKISIIIFLLLLLSLISCKENYTELIQKIEVTQKALLQQDFILTSQRNELSALVYTNTAITTNSNAADTVLTNLVSKQHTLITRLQLIIQKNKALIIKLNDGSTDANEVYKNYLANADELELMKTEINSATTSYTQLVKQGFKNLGDSIK